MKFSDQDLQKQIILFFQPYDPVKIGLFGSYVRGEHNSESDLDILYSIRKEVSLLDLVRMHRQLSEILGVKVDLVSERSLRNELLKKYIKQDLKIIYE
ncbi:MAG TPA: nucleotidyltransferase domain-containing protein [Cyclobacteriaceae bacterium]|nr:nucleotidyltransferase domain-containing protein [Cyclobacteriaceae bacterium]